MNEREEIQQRSLDLVPMYYLKTNKDIYSKNMVDVLKQSTSLTFNINNGFNEIGIQDIKIPDKYKWITRLDLKPKDDDLNTIIYNLFSILKNYFEETWDSNRIHLVSVGGGADSRMILWILKTLEIQNGKDWLGDIRFICHESKANHNNPISEADMFLKVMKLMGWRSSLYKVHKSDTCNNPDYFDLGNLTRHPNAYFMTPLIWWDDILKREEEKDTVFVTGVLAGLLLNYPKEYKKITWKLYRDFMTVARFHLSFYNNTFYTTSIPFIDYEYVASCFLLPPKAFEFPGNLDLRHLFISKFNDKIPCYYQHEYNFTISDTRLKEMNDFYYNSKFYKRFKINIQIKNHDYFNTYITDIALKVFGQSVIYKETFGD